MKLYRGALLMGLLAQAGAHAQTAQPAAPASAVATPGTAATPAAPSTQAAQAGQATQTGQAAQGARPARSPSARPPGAQGTRPQPAIIVNADELIRQGQLANAAEEAPPPRPSPAAAGKRKPGVHLSTARQLPLSTEDAGKP